MSILCSSCQRSTCWLGLPAWDVDDSESKCHQSRRSAWRRRDCVKFYHFFSFRCLLISITITLTTLLFPSCHYTLSLFSSTSTHCFITGIYTSICSISSGHFAFIMISDAIFLWKEKRTFVSNYISIQHLCFVLGANKLSLFPFETFDQITCNSFMVWAYPGPHCFRLGT